MGVRSPTRSKAVGSWKDSEQKSSMGVRTRSMGVWIRSMDVRKDGENEEAMHLGVQSIDADLPPSGVDLHPSPSRKNLGMRLGIGADWHPTAADSTAALNWRGVTASSIAFGFIATRDICDPEVQSREVL